MLRLAVGARPRALQSKIALDFGEVFAKLNPKPPRQAAAVKRAKLVAEASSLNKEATNVLRGAGGGGRYKMMRIAQAADSKQQLEILGRFGRGAPS